MLGDLAARSCLVYDSVQPTTARILASTGPALRRLHVDGAAIRRPEPRWVSWIAPTEGWVCLNVHGSSRGNPGPTGFGGVVRNASGVWLMGFTGYVGIYEILNFKSILS